MTLKQYFPLSVALLAAVILMAHFLRIPAAPLVIILLVGETMEGFLVEDHKVGRAVGDLLKAFKTKP